MVLKVQRIKWWKHPNLWKRLAIYQGIEKVLALYFVTGREGKRCSNYSTWHFYKEIKHFSSQHFQSICVLNICFIVFSFLYAFRPDSERAFTIVQELCIFYLVSLDLSCGMWDRVPWPGIETRSPTLTAQSLSQWATKEVLNFISNSCNVLFGRYCYAISWMRKWGSEGQVSFLKL